MTIFGKEIFGCQDVCGRPFYHRKYIMPVSVTSQYVPDHYRKILRETGWQAALQPSQFSTAGYEAALSSRIVAVEPFLHR
jgi:hypothetical protein